MANQANTRETGTQAALSLGFGRHPAWLLEDNQECDMSGALAITPATAAGAAAENTRGTTRGLCF